MGDPPSPRTPLETALATDAKLRGAIFTLARQQARTMEEAKDFSQEAQMRAIERSRETGEPPPPPDFRRYLLFVGGFLTRFGYNMRRGNMRHPQVDMDVSDPKTTGASSSTAERVLGDHHHERRLQRMEKELRETLATEPEKPRRIALAMLDLCDELGMHKNADFVAKLGCSIEEVRFARRRLSIHGERVRARVLSEEGGTA